MVLLIQKLLAISLLVLIEILGDLRLVKSQQGTGKEYICAARLHSAMLDIAKVAQALEMLTGAVF